MAWVHQRITVVKTIDFRLQRSRTILQHLNIAVDSLTAFNAELAADGGIAKVALEGKERHGQSQWSPKWWTFESGGHEQTGLWTSTMRHDGLMRG